MKKMAIFAGIMFFILLFSITPAIALENINSQQILYEFQRGYEFNSIDTDGNYILISELGPNNAQKTDNFEEGYTQLGSLYLYNITGKSLTQVPGNIPANQAMIVDGVVYYKSEDYRYPITKNGHKIMDSERSYYRYKPGSSTLEKLSIPTEKGLENFITNGKQLLTVTGTPWPTNVSLTLYDLETGNTQKLPTAVHPDPDRIFLLDNNVIYQQLKDSGNNLIYIYDISKDQTRTIGIAGQDYQMMLDVSGNNLLYLWNENPKPLDGEYQLRVLNITTGKTKIVSDEPMYLVPASERKTMNYHMAQMSGSTIIWPGVTFGSDISHATIQLYGCSLRENSGVHLLSENFPGWERTISENILAWIDLVDQTDRIAVYMTELNLPEPVAEIHQPAFAEPSATIAGNPVSMTLGTVAFAAASVFAGFRRKKP